MTKRMKAFIGGGVIGLLVGTVVGSVAMLMICGTVFINYELKKDEIRQSISNPLGQTNLTGYRTSK